MCNFEYSNLDLSFYIDTSDANDSNTPFGNSDIHVTNDNSNASLTNDNPITLVTQ